MNRVIIKYRLSEEGRRYALRANQPCGEDHYLEVLPDNPQWGRAVELASFSAEGPLVDLRKEVVVEVPHWTSWDLRSHRTVLLFDSHPSPQEALDAWDALRARAEEDAQEMGRANLEVILQAINEWAALPVEERDKRPIPPETPENHLALAELEAFRAARAANRAAQETAEKREREAGRQALRQESLERGSELLKARIEGGYDWAALAEREWADRQRAALADLVEWRDDLDRESYLDSPGLATIKWADKLAARGVECRLVWAAPIADGDEEDVCREPGESDWVAAAEIVHTAPTGRRMVYYGVRKT